jgi:hypothetical protein
MAPLRACVHDGWIIGTTRGRTWRSRGLSPIASRSERRRAVLASRLKLILTGPTSPGVPPPLLSPALASGSGRDGHAAHLPISDWLQSEEWHMASTGGPSERLPIWRRATSPPPSQSAVELPSAETGLAPPICSGACRRGCPPSTPRLKPAPRSTATKKAGDLKRLRLPSSCCVARTQLLSDLLDKSQKEGKHDRLALSSPRLLS